MNEKFLSAELNIKTISARIISVSLKDPVVTGYGTINSRAGVCVIASAEVKASEGEACKIISAEYLQPCFFEPLYSEETAYTILSVVEFIKKSELLSGSLIDITNKINQIRANYHAKACIEGILIALLIKYFNISYSEFFSVTVQNFPAYYLLTERDLETILQEKLLPDQVNNHKNLKIKISPAFNCDIFKIIREFNSEANILVDANGSFDPNRESYAVLQKISSLISIIEQPFPAKDLLAHAQLVKIGCNVALDESICSLEDLAVARELGALNAINLKPGRVGGMLPAFKILEYAREVGVSCWIGGMYEDRIGIERNSCLAYHPGANLPADFLAGLHLL